MTNRQGFPADPPFPCVLEAWRAHVAELRHWLLSRLNDPALAARHAVIDHHRLSKTTVPAEETLAQPDATILPVDALTTGLAASLAALDPDDRDVILRCDLEGQTQTAYATAHQLTLPAVKSRILRARVRLRRHLVAHAGVRFGPTGQVCCHGPFGQGD